MNLPKNAATLFAVIVIEVSLIVSMIVFIPNNNLRAFANSALLQNNSASQADQSSVAPFVENGTKNGTFSLNQSPVPALSSESSTSIGDSSELPIPGAGHGPGEGTAAGPALPSFLAAATVLLEDDFGRADNSVVGSPLVGGN